MRQSARVVQEPVEDRGELAGLLLAVGGLSAECKRVLTLRKVYGWEHERIASHLGIGRLDVENDLRVCVLSIARYYDRS